MSAKSWSQLCDMRDDVRSGELTLAEFAADLYDARSGVAPVVYRDPGMFFDRTFPTYRMKSLAADVLLRLAGKGGKPVLRLQVAYGGGKTHTLIALMHLAERGNAHATHRTVSEFLTFAGLTSAPAARVAILPGDKIDVIEGLEVMGPTGHTRRVRTLWGALAYQLAGDAGFVRMQKHDEEFMPPAEPLLVDLLRAPESDGLGTLVLVDEAVLYYRSLVNSNPKMLGTLKDFFQLLTQAAAKAGRCTLVASLIASHVEANDSTGVLCLNALEEVFERIAEPVEPVNRDDIAEILRRRLFRSVPGPEERRSVVDSMMAAMHRLPVADSQRNQDAYDNLVASYPFHPDLINVLYQKWTQLGKFQRTRGALRLLAYALRESATGDLAPFVGPSAFLPYNTSSGVNQLSPALRELTNICDESLRWSSSITGELEKARTIQSGLPSLEQREIEQAVVATFLHSQPMGARATPAELTALLAHPSIDPASLEDGLRKWRERSWFLVENDDVWQLGIVPNLTHMHYNAKTMLSEPEVEDELRNRIKLVTALKESAPGVELHMLPQSPGDVSDTPQLRYLVLDPSCAVTPGQPLPQGVEAYFNEKRGARIFRNNILALAPDSAAVAGLREQVRNWLGYGKLEKPEHQRLLNDDQKKTLTRLKQESQNKLPEAVTGAYRILVAVNDTGEVEAQTLRSGGAPWTRIQNLLTEQERLVAETLDPDLILPDSYFEIWPKDRPAMRVQDIVAAFGQFPRLPRLLRVESLYDTLKRGLAEGVLVLRLPRADGSARTWWRNAPDDDTLTRAELEVLPVARAELHDLDYKLLAPDGVSGLWAGNPPTLTLAQLRVFFDGQHAPALAAGVLDSTVRQSVKLGVVMAQHLGAAYYREEVPGGVLSDDLVLYPAPARLNGADLTQQALPAVWRDGQANLAAMRDALAAGRPTPLPWTLLVAAVDEALSMRLFEVAGGVWPCSPVAADDVSFRLTERIDLTPEMIVRAIEYADSQTPNLAGVKDTIETHFFGGRTLADKEFFAAAKRAVDSGLLTAVDRWQGSDPGSVRVRRPDVVLFAETDITPFALQTLAERLDELTLIDPTLNLHFRISLTVDGQQIAPETVERLDAVLGEVVAGWVLR